MADRSRHPNHVFRRFGGHRDGLVGTYRLRPWTNVAREAAWNASQGHRGPPPAKVRVLAQAGRVVIPGTPRPILKLLDKFLRTVETDENESSWHPKVAMLRFHRNEDVADRHWRIWLGSRNLTKRDELGSRIGPGESSRWARSADWRVGKPRCRSCIARKTCRPLRCRCRSGTRGAYVGMSSR